ncbi:hypothetical protein LOK49_LG01G02943 [Camellia lanceoleosa]|uniref:Uncharacterized protein n=1 Tax=Camellia lanceoleosa TaxID=1840588 RepID=A0ACC0IYL1_9ERIC|nr:hypothetical protein LOK49_LG01G02943 [Camellia lanceoleosa]
MKRKMEKNSAEKEETIEMFDHGDDQQQQQQQMVCALILSYGNRGSSIPKTLHLIEAQNVSDITDDGEFVFNGDVKVNLVSKFDHPMKDAEIKLIPNYTLPCSWLTVVNSCRGFVFPVLSGTNCCEWPNDRLSNRSMRSVGSVGGLNCTQLGAEEHGGGSKIYLICRNALVVYDPVKQTARYLKTPGLQRKCEAIPHIPCLVSLKDVMGDNAKLSNIKSRFQVLQLECNSNDGCLVFHILKC